MTHPDREHPPRLGLRADSLPVALDRAARHFDVAVLDRYGLIEGRLKWRHWPRNAATPGSTTRPTGDLAVVLLHGGSGSWTHWSRNIGPLCAEFNVLAPDLPGYGDSGPVPGGTPVVGLAERLVRSLDAVWPAGHGPLAVVGFSFGAIVAAHLVQQILAADAQRVRQLVIVGAVGLGLPRDQPLPMQPWRGIEDLAELRAIHRQNLLTLMLKHSDSIDDEALAIQDANVRRTRYLSKREAAGPALALLLQTLKLPVHGIWGDSDVTAAGRVTSMPELLNRLHPGSSCDLIADCGHWAMWERPAEFNRLLLHALRSV